MSFGCRATVSLAASRWSFSRCPSMTWALSVCSTASLPRLRTSSAGTPGVSSIDVSWDAIPGAARYRAEHRSATSTEWTVHDDTIAVTSHTVDGLACGNGYGLRVRSYGDGVTYETVWSLPSAVVSGTTGECVPPVFDPLVLQLLRPRGRGNEHFGGHGGSERTRRRGDICDHVGQ